MIQNPRLLAALVAVASCAALPARAEDSTSSLDEPYLAAAFMLGFAGKVSIDADSATVGNGSIDVAGGASQDSDAEVGLGGALYYMRPLHRYFALGGRFAVQTWHSADRTRLDEGMSGDNDTARNIAFDLAIVPQGRVPLSRSIELYLSIPVGLTLDLLNEIDASVDFPDLATGASIDTDPGFGWNLAFMLGARFQLSRSIGLFTEVGYALHQFSHDVHIAGSALGVEGEVVVDFDVTWTQGAWNLGLYF